MKKNRKIDKTFKSKPTMEGAGVRLKRGFGFYEVPLFDPFLLFDDFHSENPDDYIAGFPWHPHRGIETVTYMLHGKIEHGDSLGNTGVIKPGGIQWMTAGSGIIHQEMPVNESRLLWGTQLWVNLPKDSKMISPRYREVNELPVIENGAKIKIIAGEYDGVKGPLKEVICSPIYLDVSLPADYSFNYPVEDGFTVFTYNLEGAGEYNGRIIRNDELVLFERNGNNVSIITKTEALRFLLIAGKSLNEPVAWQGPIVMNTDEELRVAFKEYQNGTFIK